MISLPKIMVAPNGARRNKSSHPAIPITIEELVATCKSCAAEGAEGVHAHVREPDGAHSLDAGLYRSVIDQLHSELPGWFVQITSETAGRFSDTDQRNLLKALRPKSVSVAVREFVPDAGVLSDAKDAYHWAYDNGVAIQHICYSRDELDRLINFIEDGTVPGTSHHVQLVLGAYDGSKVSRPEDIEAFIAPMLARQETYTFDWMLCAFGAEETDCLLRTFELGGKARIGFENSLWNRDGTLARDNAERVSELVGLARSAGLL